MPSLVFHSECSACIIISMSSSMKVGVEKDYTMKWFYNCPEEKCMGKRPAGKEEDASVQ